MAAAVAAHSSIESASATQADVRAVSTLVPTDVTAPSAESKQNVSVAERDAIVQEQQNLAASLKRVGEELGTAQRSLLRVRRGSVFDDGSTEERIRQLESEHSELRARIGGRWLLHENTTRAT